MKIEVVRIWSKRALVHILDGQISFRVGFLPHYSGDGYYLKFPDNMDVAPTVRKEIEKQIMKEIGTKRKSR